LDWANLANYLGNKKREDTAKNISLKIAQGILTGDPQGHGYQHFATKKHKKKHRVEKVLEEEQATSIETIPFSDFTTSGVPIPRCPFNS
jgi:hypothetical protein